MSNEVPWYCEQCGHLFYTKAIFGEPEKEICPSCEEGWRELISDFSNFDTTAEGE